MKIWNFGDMLRQGGGMLLLASLDMPVLRTTIEAWRPASGPFTERYYLESFANLLLDEFGDEVGATSADQSPAQATGKTEVPANP